MTLRIVNTGLIPRALVAGGHARRITRARGGDVLTVSRRTYVSGGTARRSKLAEGDVVQVAGRFNEFDIAALDGVPPAREWVSSPSIDADRTG